MTVTLLKQRIGCFFVVVFKLIDVNFASNRNVDLPGFQ